MNDPHKFKHNPTYDQSKGRVKVFCACGAQSGRLDSWDEAQEAYLAHVGLKELERKQQLH